MNPKPLSAVPFLAALACASASSKPPDTRSKLWETELTARLREPPGWSAIVHHDSGGLAFSPDGLRLAAVLVHTRFPHGSVHILILDLQTPNANVREIDISDTCGAELTWNEAEDALLVCGTVIRLSDGGSCDATDLRANMRWLGGSNVYWLDAQHVLQGQSGDVLDRDCQPAGRWPLAPGWQVNGIVASKGWVLLTHTEQHLKDQRPTWTCQISIVDRDSRHALSGWPSPKLQRVSQVVLAAGAQALCYNADGDLRCQAGGTGLVAQVPDLRVPPGRTGSCPTFTRCAEHQGQNRAGDRHGGQNIRLPKPMRHCAIAQASTSSARVIAEKWESAHSPWWEMVLFWWFPADPGAVPALPRVRMVFDLRSGQEISVWKPRIQKTTSPFTTDHPWHCALSADGRLLAESGDGIVGLYQLPR